MQKISSILPSSPRVLSVDMKESNPIRPGTPGFGRPEGISTLRSRPEDTTLKASEIQNKMADWRSKDTQKAAMVKDLADRFFADKKTEVEPKTEVKPISAEETVQVAEAPPQESESYEELPELSSPISNPNGGPYPKGSFIGQVA